METVLIELYVTVYINHPIVMLYAAGNDLAKIWPKLRTGHLEVLA